MDPNIDFSSLVREKCSDFIGGQWEKLNDKIEITKLESGFCNRTFRCTLEQHEANEPKNVIVRFYGSGVVGEGSSFKLNGEAGEAIVCQILAEKQLGPQLLAVFNGGRIEQFIEGRNITCDDFDKHPSYFKIIAKKMAKYHTLDMPISKQPKLIEHLLGSYEYSKLSKNLDSLSAENRQHVMNLFNFPLEDEFNFIFKCVPKLNSKIVFCHNDLYHNNIMLRNDYKTDEDRLVILDYDLCGYFYRAFDIAFFVLSNEFQINHKDDGEIEIKFLKERDIEAIKIQFLKDYLDELKNLDEKFDNETNSFEHLLTEVNCFSLLVFLLNMAFVATYINNSDNESSFAIATEFVESYKKTKKIVLETYPQYFT